MRPVLRTGQVRAAHARRPEIGHDRNTIGGLDRGFANQQMATIISRHFSAGVCRLDRPSPVVLCAEEIGDNARLLDTLRRLRDLGNTVIVVEHDEDAILAADHVVDFGPGAGIHGVGRSFPSSAS
jgi:hypothetical protein